VATVLGKASAAFFAEVVQSLGLPAALVKTSQYRPGDEGRLPPQAVLLADVMGVAALLGW
jgi:hypothetical protein